MSKEVKSLIIQEMQGRLGDCRDLLVANVSKIDGVAVNKFRIALREKGITILALKNSLAKVVLEKNGVKDLGDVLEGPSALIWGAEDIVALAKEMTRWTKQLPLLELKGGAVDGQPINAAGVVKLSKSPSRLELIARILGQLLSPGANLAGALKGPGGKLAGQLKTMAEKEGEAAA
jgi:large subunit ribosomal protein L10